LGSSNLTPPYSDKGGVPKPTLRGIQIPPKGPQREFKINFFLKGGINFFKFLGLPFFNNSPKPLLGRDF